MVKSSGSALVPVMIGGCLVILVSFGIRASFGVFQIPIATEFGWPRAEFSLALALQNIAWGLGAPMFGAVAERFGDRRAMVAGILVYAAGLLLSVLAVTPAQHQLLQFLIGLGIAGTGMALILAIVGRAASDANRAMALAIVSAMGSVGQVAGPLLAEWLVSIVGWQGAFVVFAAAVLACFAALPLLGMPRPLPAAPGEGLGEAVRRAFRDPSFTLIYLGFFSCGYQVGFLTSHFPAFVTEVCGPIAPGSLLHAFGISTTSALGAAALSLVGLANIGGTLLTGWMAGFIPRKNLLAGIYLGRTLVGIAFILTPMTPETVLLFSFAMGTLWLATVPLTAGLVGYIFGLRYVATLYGFVFLSHQIGSFLGIWLGGRLYDVTGDYTLVWWIGIAVGAFSALVHLPIRERPLGQPVPA